MKRIIAITTAAVLFFTMASATSAMAGAARRHTIEGFMIGTGVAILGAAILNGINNNTAPKEVIVHNGHRPPGYEKPYNRHYQKHHQNRYAAHRNRGHWEIEKTWVAPEYEERWNPGHYNPRGEWISGRYEKFVIQEGYWIEKKVWVWH